MKKYPFILFLTLITNVLLAQDEAKISLHSSGKIYLVVGVLITIFIGIIAFLIYLERKLNSLEEQIKQDE